jgi:hypothetical protein
MSICRCGWLTCSECCCASPAPGTTQPEPGRLLLSRCCRVRSACTPPRSSPSGSPLWPMGCWSGWSPPGPADAAGSGGPGGPAGGNCAGCSCLGPSAGGSSSAAVTASATGSWAGCIWPSSNATRCSPSGHRDPSRPTGWSSRPSWSGKATSSLLRSNPTSYGPPAPTAPNSEPSGSTTPSACPVCPALAGRRSLLPHLCRRPADRAHARRRGRRPRAPR